MDVNLNDTVTVKLRPHGVCLLLEYWRTAGVKHLEDVPGYRGGGVLKVPLHEFCHIFGPALYLGEPTPVETDLEIVPT